MDFETAANGSCPFDQRGSARTATSSAQVNIGMARGGAEASSAQVNTGMAREGASVRMAMSSAQGSIWPGGLLSVRQPAAPKCTLAWPGRGSCPYGSGQRSVVYLAGGGSFRTAASGAQVNTGLAKAGPLSVWQ